MAEVSREQGDRVAWALFWRYIVGLVIAGGLAKFLVGGLIGFAWSFHAATEGHRTAPLPTSLIWLNTIVSTAVVFIISFLVFRWVLRHMLGRRIGGAVLRIELIDAHSMDRT